METVEVERYANPAPRMTAYEFLAQEKPEKPLPALPSPTLTNPDMVLPSEHDLPALSSPARSAKSVRRPPSPSYLREKTSGDVREGTEGGAVAPPKRGLMSRKMMLLRSKTASNTNLKGEPQSTIPRSVPTPTSDKPLPDPGPTLASSPTLMDVGNLAPPTPGPEQSEDKRLSASASSFNSEDMAGIPSFLSRYDTNDGATTDEDLTDTDSPTAQSKLGYSVRIEGGLEAERRQQEEEEQNSAMLSKRAEQILANAKKRLNLMEGNLRGARDLVAPLTAANLKRATSLGSAQQSPYNPSTRDRFASTMYSQDQGSPRRSSRILHAQASSPTIGRDYQGHARGFSETQIPERPHTALGRSNGPLRKGRIPVKANDGSWAQSLRSSRSYDSLGAQNGAVRPASQDAHPLHVRGSPDPALAPLPEDEDTTQQESYPSGRKSEISVETDKQDALGIYRPASRTEDLREQMSSLKGRISSLRDRAREDSLKRQSLQSIRAPTPLNNAVSEPPEFYYGQAQSYSGPLPGSNSGVGKISPKDSPISPQFSKRSWEQKVPTPPGRNAFAQQAAIQGQQQRSLSPEKRGVASNLRQLASDRGTVPETTHRRTPSGTAIVASAANRYSHHEAYKHHLPAPTASDNDISPFPTNEPPTPDYDNPVSPPSTDIDGASVYDDAPTEQPPVVAHEDRDDAFDYEHFFLHSAMGTYGRRGLHGRQHSSSSSDDRDSVSSASTAKPGPEEHFNPESGIFPPPTPETPERLREIERNLQHKRTESSDSVSTVDSFATAAEASSPPLPTLSREVSNMGWPIPPSDNFSRPSSRPSSRPGSRPGTANKRAPEKQTKDNDSERADSGVGLPRRSGSGRSVKKIAGGLAAMPPRSSAHAATSTTTPPISPHQMTLHDPATVAVNALLNPDGKPLGLKDKAVLFANLPTKDFPDPSTQPNFQTHPDMDPASGPNAPFYRPEPIATFHRLPNLRPSVFYLFGEQSNLSTPTLKADKLAHTGTGVGGSGGVQKGRVRDVTLEGVGHLIPMEAVERTAEECAQWLVPEIEGWTAREESERREWAAVPKAQKSVLSEQYRQTMNGNWAEKQEGPKGSKL